jgi:hypothetical protein
MDASFPIMRIVIAYIFPRKDKGKNLKLLISKMPTSRKPIFNNKLEEHILLVFANRRPRLITQSLRNTRIQEQERLRL